MPRLFTAVVTGASKGLGLAIARALVERGTTVVVDARDGRALHAAVTAMDTPDAVVAIPGDVSDRHHRAALADAVERLGGLDLLVNNASVLGPSPQPALADYPLDVLERVYAVNVFAPIALTARLVPALKVRAGRVVNVTSDAAREAYPGWGGYGSAKAALDQATAVFAVEHPDLGVYAFDPGDMATDMHQQAFPGQDISDRPRPESVVPAFLGLLERDLPSGRYRAADLLEGVIA